MNLDGIISLLIACVELVFVINLLIFAGMNAINKLVVATIFLLLALKNKTELKKEN